LSSISIALLVPLPVSVPFVEPAPPLLAINLATVDATHLVQILKQQPLSLLVDCGALPCQRTLGICFLVSQLLILRQTGSRIHLRNVSSVLQRCLQRLHISSLFTLVD
jgi:anti-anti-sigma regulatory factor